MHRKSRSFHNWGSSTQPDHGGTANGSIAKKSSIAADGKILASGHTRFSLANGFQASPNGGFAKKTTTLGYPSVDLRGTADHLVLR
jgi:hypothetical protein